MNSQNSKSQNEPKLREVLKDDFKKINFGRELRREYREISDFYLNDVKKKKLDEMHQVKRWILKNFWLLQSMFLHLNPLRRILVVLGVALYTVSGSANSGGNTFSINNNGFLSGILFLFVLLLELKDKLLMHNELQAGRKVQQSLMPEQSPQFPGWEIWLYTAPANQVGGDLVDYFRESDEKALITIADISGKELQAALLMTKLQATIRALVRDDGKLAEFASNINKIFHRDSPSHSFASMIYSEINKTDGNLSYINAGHFPPLIIRSDKIEIEPKGGPALGLMSKVNFTEQNITLQSGDIYIAYTDGIIEARDENGQFYGMERFLRLLEIVKGFPIGQIGEKITRNVLWFAGDAPVSDDLSIVILKKK